jgi:hypothetical protein
MEGDPHTSQNATNKVTYQQRCIGFTADDV